MPFVGERLLAGLVAEAERQRPGGAPGDILRRLAVSRQLREAVSAASGAPLVPTYTAVYQYHGPGTAQRPHHDGPGYDLVFHLVLEHEHATSLLTVEGHPEPVSLPPGHGLLLRGQEVRHWWTPFGARERRTMVAVGFHERPGGAA